MHWRRKWQPTPVFLPGESQGRGSVVGCRLWGRTESDTTEVTQQQQQQPSYLQIKHTEDKKENLQDKPGQAPQKAAGHGVAKSRTRLSDFTFTFHFHVLEKEMATYSSVLAWRIPGTGELGGLPSVGSHRDRHD